MSKFDILGSHKKNNMRNRPYYSCRVCGNKITTCRFCLSNVGRTRSLVKEQQPVQVNNNCHLPELNDDFEEFKYFKQRNKSMDAPKQNKISVSRNVNFLDIFKVKNKLKCKTRIYPTEGDSNDLMLIKRKKEVLHQIKTNNIPEIKKREDYNDYYEFRKDNDWNKMIHKVKNKIEDKKLTLERKNQRKFKSLGSI